MFIIVIRYFYLLCFVWSEVLSWSDFRKAFEQVAQKADVSVIASMSFSVYSRRVVSNIIGQNSAYFDIDT